MLTRTFGLLAIILRVVLLDVGPPPQTKLLPVDEAAQDESFLAFRTRLQRALREKDADYVLGIVAPDIKLSFGGSYGTEDFKRWWLTPGTETTGSTIWIELGDILAMGATQESYRGSPIRYVAPYVFSRWPDEYDAFEYVAVVRDQVPLRAEPKPDGAVVANLSYDILRVTESRVNDSSDWNKVETISGQTGYVRSSDIRSPIDYRAFFEKIDGAWKMTIFIAGD